MENETIGLIESVLRSDSTVTTVERQHLVTLLADGKAGDRKDSAVEPFCDRIVRRAEAGKLLGRSAKTVDRLAARGVLYRVKFPTFTKSAGYRLSDIEALIAGGIQDPTGGTSSTGCEA